MQQQKKQYFLIDFDSTFIKNEGLEELAAIALKNSSQKKKILDQIQNLTKQGMEGNIPFDISLTERLKLLKANKTDIEKAVKKLIKNISTSIKRNKNFFKIYNTNIYIISGGFKEFIVPVVKTFGIDESHVFANTFVFDKKGNIIGVDNKNLLSQNDGKVKLVKSLRLDGDLYIIGDGYTDYKLKELGLVKKFIAFTENIEREIVVKKADIVAPSFDEFLYVNKLPMSISYPKTRIKVLLLEHIDQSAVVAFEKEGYHISYFDKSLNEEELIEKINNIHILGIRSRTHITKQVLNYANRLLTIGIFAIGTNQVDVDESARLGVSVFNAPYSNSRSVVELMIGEIIMLMRQVFDKSTKLRQGIWDKSAIGSHEVKGKTLGIIGYGNIGMQLGVIAESLGMRVLFYDKVEKPVLGNAKKCETLSELLKSSDIITVHVDGNLKNTNLIGDKEFRMMKDGVIFLNASRGFVVDISSLTKYLKTGKVKGAAIDVFPKEPKSNSEPFTSSLQSMPNVILTPHIGGSTIEAQRKIGDFVSKKVIDYVNTGDTYLSVNLPNIQLPVQGTAHRLLHIHKNVPGILAQINSILGEKDINISGQYLKTTPEIGYVITDVDKKYDVKVLNILKQIPNTVRFRVLY